MSRGIIIHHSRFPSGNSNESSTYPQGQIPTSDAVNQSPPTLSSERAVYAKPSGHPCANRCSNLGDIGCICRSSVWNRAKRGHSYRKRQIYVEGRTRGYGRHVIGGRQFNLLLLLHLRINSSGRRFVPKTHAGYRYLCGPFSTDRTESNLH